MSPASAMANEAHTSARAATVLIVEDEALPRVALTDYLQDCGYKVYEARSTKDAVEIIDTIEGIDLVFCDIQLPGVINGIGLATMLRNKRPDIKIVLTSGYAAGKAKSEGKEWIATTPFVEKPYMLPEVESLFRRSLGV